LMFLRKLVEQRGVPFSQRINLVLQSLSLHLVKFTNDGIGIGCSCITESQCVAIHRIDQRISLIAGCYLAFISLTFDSSPNIAATLCNLRHALCITSLNRVDDLLPAQTDLAFYFVD